MGTNLKLRVSFYTRYGKTAQVEQSPIMLRVAYRGKRKTFGQLPLETNPKDFVGGRVRKGSPNSEAINRQLDCIEAKLMVYAEDLYQQNVLSLDTLKRAYRGEDATSRYISSLFDEFISEEEKRVEANLLSKGTLAKYRRYAAGFLVFLSARYSQKDMLITEITKKTLSDYENFLECVSGYHHNTLIKYLRFVVNVMRYAGFRGYLKSNLVADVSYNAKPSERGFITSEELKKVETVKLSGHLSVVRDIFLFACYTGISYCDVFALTETNLLTNNGHPWLVFKRQKTGQPSQVYLLDKAIAILNKYEDMRPADGKLLPVCCNQVINRDLKKIAKKCGIDRTLTYHMARHTFATLSLTNGVSMETVSKTLGHSSIKTTQIYARILPKKLETELSRLNNVI